MAQPIIQPSFAAGELSPSLYARVDLAKFHVGAALLRNLFVDYRGGVSNRPGTAFVGPVIDSTKPNRLIPFQFSTVQAYALVFGHKTMKVVINGGYVTDHNTGLDYVLVTPYAATDLALLKFTQSADVMTLVHPNYTPMNLTRTAHDAWALTTIIFAPSVNPPANVVAQANIVGGTTQYAYSVTAIGSNGLTESVGSAAAVVTDSFTMSTTPATFVVVTWDAVPGAQIYNVYRQPEVDGAAAGAGQLYGFVGSTTSTDFVDKNIAPDFTRTPPQFGNPFPTGGGGVLTSVQVVPGLGLTAVPAVVSSGDGTGAAVTVSLQLQGVAFGNFGTGYTPGDILTILGGSGTRAARIRVLTKGAASAFDVIDPGSYVSVPGTPAVFFGTAVTQSVATTGGTGTGCQVACYWGIGDPVIVNPGVNYTFINLGLSGGGLNNPGGASISGTIGTASGNPTCVTYFQERQVFAAPPAAPETFYMSKTGDFPNFGYSVPARDDDSITGTIASQQVNAIKHLLSMNSLIAFSSGGAWRIDSGAQGGAVTPSAIEAAPQSFSGCSDVPPITVNYDILYVQEKGSIVRDLAYNFYVNVYTGADMTVLSNHLFYGHTIKEWAWAEEPFKIIWAVREDGVLLSFTYLKEQDVYGWAHHDTQGLFKSVCTISEAGENMVYLIVERLIQGNLVQYVERMQSRNMSSVPELGVPADLSKAWFVDCGLAYPLRTPNATATPQAKTAQPSLFSVNIVNGGQNYTAPQVNVLDDTGTGALVNLTVTGGVITGATVVAAGSNLTAPTLEIIDSTGSGGVLSAVLARAVVVQVVDPLKLFIPHVGDIFRGNNGWGRVIQVVGRNLTVDVVEPFTSIFPATPGTWSCTAPVSQVSGLDHLEGAVVSILADGNVMTPQQVQTGTVTLDAPAAAITIGLPYLAQFQSLPLDVPGEPATVQGKRKKITAATLRVQDTRGLLVGHNFTEMNAFKERDAQTMGNPILPITGDERIPLDPDWEVPGQICAQQPDPLPCTILALLPEVTVGDTAE